MPTILLIMRKPGNIRVLSQALTSHGHTCTGADNCDAVVKFLDQRSAPDLALVDIAGFGESAWTTCEKLQQKDVPFIVLSAKQELQLSSKTLNYGAKSILEKPVVKASLLQLISGITQTGADSKGSSFAGKHTDDEIL